MIRLVEFRKRFGRRWAVDGLSLHVPAGEIYGLLGHNGAGKSTAIGAMLGQVWPTSGQVSVCGYDVTSERRLALQSVGAIFESPAFYDYLSGWRNLEILASYTAPASRPRIREVIDWVGLSGREGSTVKTYSHGMRARLALAQALLPGPSLLILDEPGDGLDPEGIHEMRQTVLRLHRELGLTILLSSHLLSEVEQLCTRIAVMHQGRKVFEGPLAEARQSRRWVRLRVGNFKKAVGVLKEAGLIQDSQDGEDEFTTASGDAGDSAQTPPCGMIELAKNAATDQVVRLLVGKEIPVFEITPVEQSLEAFYLALMKNASAAERRLEN